MFRQEDEEGEDMTQCTLVPPVVVISGGAPTPTLSGNQLEGVDPDGSVFGVNWAFDTDGVAFGENIHLFATIE